jgi:hypothetical protein
MWKAISLARPQPLGPSQMATPNIFESRLFLSFLKSEVSALMGVFQKQVWGQEPRRRAPASPTHCEVGASPITPEHSSILALLPKPRAVGS